MAAKPKRKKLIAIGYRQTKGDKNQVRFIQYLTTDDFNLVWKNLKNYSEINEVRNLIDSGDPIELGETLEESKFFEKGTEFWRRHSRQHCTIEELYNLPISPDYIFLYDEGKWACKGYNGDEVKEMRLAS